MPTHLRRLLAAFLAVGCVLVGAGVPSNAADPRLDRGLWVDADSLAAHAAQSDPTFRKLARTPQAIWLTEVTAPLGQAKQVVRAVATQAAAKRRTPVFVLYAIPGRDCGLHSSGGLEAKAYRSWVRKIARGLRGTRAMVIVEPDAVASLGDCAGQGKRAKLLRTTVKRLNAVGAWVYLDAGHSAWQRPATIAQRLRRAGVARARGFATNVSNFRTTRAEKAFGRQVRRQLRKRGIRGARQVIDTSRNGNGPAADAAWCNPPHARVGTSPRIVNRKKVDALLWIKRPGESDGPCNGGPAAGEWWPDGATELLR